MPVFSFLKRQVGRIGSFLVQLSRLLPANGRPPKDRRSEFQRSQRANLSSGVRRDDQCRVGSFFANRKFYRMNANHLRT